MPYKINPVSNFTNLPVKVVDMLGSTGNLIYVHTPHKGFVEIKTKQRFNGFFSRGELTKTGSEIMNELETLENEAKEYLFNQWLINNK